MMPNYTIQREREEASRSGCSDLGIREREGERERSNSEADLRRNSRIAGADQRKTSDSCEMAAEKSSADWIPAGWTVEVKVRKDGRQDKYYVDPSKELKFNSKPEVFRYLNNIETSNSKPKGQQKGISTRSAKNFVDEKVEAEGLTPRRIKEINVREEGCWIKKDPDTSRDLEKEELGRLASKSKNKDRSTMELEDDKISSPDVAEEQKLAESVADRQITRSQSLKLVGVVKGEQNLGSTCTGDCTPLNENASEQYVEGDAMSNIKLPEDKDLEQTQGKSDSSRSVCVSAHIVGEIPENLPLKNRAKRNGNRKNQNDLPRRASKRLAGIKADNTAAELTYCYDARRVAPRKLDESKASTDSGSGNSTPPEECSKRSEAENEADKKPEHALVLPPDNLSIPDEHVSKTETDEKLINSSFGDLWMDPCIEFAIKTLTGSIPLGDEIKTEESPGPFQGLTFGDSWTDPCIEFAIKTLTGEIPVGEDLSIQDYVQQQLSSSENRGDTGLALPNGALDTHFDGIEKPLYEQQALAMATLPHTGNASLRNSCGDGLHHHVGPTK